MASKALLSFFFVATFSTFVHQGLADGVSLDQFLTGLGDLKAVKEAQCMQKLAPCQQHLKALTNPPDPACCVPLTEMVTNGTECLCAFLNNPQLLGSMKVNKDDLLKLPSACGASVDPNTCNTTGASSTTTTTTTTGTSTASIDPSSFIPKLESTSSTKMITPNGILHFGGPGFVALLIALVFSAY